MLAVSPSAGPIAAAALALQKMSSGNRQIRIPVADASALLPKSAAAPRLRTTQTITHELVRTQYKARVRQITLLFPHVSAPSSRRCGETSRSGTRPRIWKRPGRSLAG